MIASYNQILVGRFIRPKWMDLGACLTSDVDFFSERKKDIAAAMRACNACAVQDLCGEYAIDEEIADGVWGGMSDVMRAKVKREMKNRG